ncbi:membrane protein [Skermanella stibiiresistens SB22]|uniref:Membrane protein n=1 Tax=Skermanella stibiiresistens SB22 TaxID=1385369 RepID=W9H915_9PROT|nr:DUF924 family protein [Skermanella stibiiresistens]EWY41147.1 membrane protein [Skermanella stibiiresistens SB22]
MMTFHDVLGFWFRPDSRPNWFKGNAAFDADIGRLLLPLHEEAAANRLPEWRDHPQGCLALVILLDQVPRNVFRDSVRAFATDPTARALTRLAIDRGYDDGLDDDQRCFLYLPLEHSEDIADQRLSVELFRFRVRDPVYQDYAERHLKVIERFGRFPHRNRILGRVSTEEELDFLKRPGSSF